MAIDINIKNKDEIKSSVIKVIIVAIIVIFVLVIVSIINPGQKIVDKNEKNINLDLCNGTYGLIEKEYLCDDNYNCLKLYVNCSALIYGDFINKDNVVRVDN